MYYVRTTDVLLADKPFHNIGISPRHANEHLCFPQTSTPTEQCAKLCVYVIFVRIVRPEHPGRNVIVTITFPGHQSQQLFNAVFGTQAPGLFILQL
jgi:hypothetical protein